MKTIFSEQLWLGAFGKNPPLWAQINYPMKKISIVFKILLFPIIMQKLESSTSQSRENGTKPCFRDTFSIFEPKICHYGPNHIPDEKNFNNIFKISWFPIIVQKIRKFPQVNLEKMKRNLAFGQFLAFSGKKNPALWAKLNTRRKKCKQYFQYMMVSYHYEKNLEVSTS